MIRGTNGLHVSLFSYYSTLNQIRKININITLNHDEIVTNGNDPRKLVLETCPIKLIKLSYHIFSKRVLFFIITCNVFSEIT